MKAYLQHGYGTNGPFMAERVEVFEDILPWQELGLSYTATGCGNKIPTIYKVRWEGRTYRVYCRIFSNIGTLYIVSRGEEIKVDIDS